MPDESSPAWLKITWTVVGDKTYTVYWTNDPPGAARVWDAVDGPALGDSVDNGDGTKTWADKGTDPDMAGLAPGDVGQRFYKVVVE